MQGIVFSHQYTLLDVITLFEDASSEQDLAVHSSRLNGGNFQFGKKKEKKVRAQLVKLQNPWGKGEWKGAWSDQDSKNWTPSLKQKLGYSPQNDDGVFFMSFQDFSQLFEYINVRHFHD